MQQRGAERSKAPAEAVRSHGGREDQRLSDLASAEAMTPGAVAQRQLQSTADASPRARQMTAFRAMANNSPQARQLRSFQAMADQAPTDSVAQLFPVVAGKDGLPTTAADWFERFQLRGNREPNILRVLEHLETKGETFASEEDLVVVTRLAAQKLTARTSRGPEATTGPSDLTTTSSSSATASAVIVESKAEKAEGKSGPKVSSSSSSSGGKKKRFGRGTPLDLRPRSDRREEFAKLDPEGRIHPNLVRFSQSGCTAFYQEPFKDNRGAVIRGYHDHVSALKNGFIAADSTPAIVITCFQVNESTWEIVSVDNRRLKVHREAGAMINYVKVAWDQLTSQQQGHFDGKASDNLNVR